MPPLLVVPDPPDASYGLAVAELPALSELIRLGDAAPLERDWRSGMLRDLGAAALVEASPAQVASLALPLETGSVCIATPVHVVAGMSRVHLHAAGIVSLTAAERERFQVEFAAQFGDEMRLHSCADGWVLEAPWALQADDGDPGSWRGMALSREPAASPERRALRRAGAELEMWLAGLDWNQQRERSGKLAANLLWLWGGGAVLPRSGLPTLRGMKVHARHADPWLAGVATLTDQVVQPLPSAWVKGCADAGAVILLKSPADADPGLWQQWEELWFAPFLRELSARRINSLILRIGRRSWRVRSGKWRRLLRRTSPWWQAAQA